MIYCKHKNPPGFCPVSDCSHRSPDPEDVATKVTGAHDLPGPSEWLTIEKRLCETLDETIHTDLDPLGS